MSIQPKKVAVMGVGWVGGALARYFTDAGFDPVLYDPPKRMGSVDDLAKADIFFICVPSPFDPQAGGFDLTYVERAASAIPGEKIVVVKSTVLPGTTDALERRFPRHRVLFNPEFLREKFADHDMRHPERQIVGVTDRSRSAAEDVLAVLPKAAFTRIVAAAEAETVKYFGNCFLAMKVVFANQIFDVCEKLGLDYDVVRGCSSADPRIGSSHLLVKSDGYRGYGGTCFPKDVRAFIQFGDSLGLDLELLKTCEKLNDELGRRKIQAR